MSYIVLCSLCRLYVRTVDCTHAYFTIIIHYSYMSMHAQRTRGCSITLPLSLTLVTVTCCFTHLLNTTSPFVISGSLDYHEPTGAGPPVISCSYSLTITIPAGSSAGDGVVAIINDTIYEGPEDFFLDLSVALTFHDVGINEWSPLRATVEIRDDDGEIPYDLFQCHILRMYCLSVKICIILFNTVLIRNNIPQKCKLNTQVHVAISSLYPTSLVWQG